MLFRSLVDATLTELGRLSDDTTQAASLAATVGERMREAGLDVSLRPVVPTAPDYAVSEVHETARTSLDPADEAVETTRRVPPSFDPAMLLSSFADAGAHAEQAANALRERCAVTLALSERAREVAAERSDVDRLRLEARDAQLEATESVGRRNEAGQRLEGVAMDWRDAVAHWASSGPLATTAESLAPPELATLLNDQDAARRAGERAHAWMRGRLPDLHAEVDRARRALGDLDARITEANEELSALRSGVDPEPGRPAFATAARDQKTGAAFYRLVDFADGLDERARAGCESALESSGLLNAWVSADGSLTDPLRADVGAALVESTLDGRTLADVLVPAVPPGSPVPADVVRRVLAQVSLDGAGGLAVSTDGRWRAGVLAGAMSKPDAEFVGAGARESARQRRIDELVELIGTLAGARDGAAASLAVAREHAAAWESHIDAYPHDRDVLAAHVRLRAAAEAADEANRKSISLRDKHSGAADRLRARGDELTRDARAAGLDASVDSLQTARAAALEARKAAEQLAAALTTRCLGAVERLDGALSRHAKAAEDLAEIATSADRACLDHTGEAAGYEERVRSIGGAAEQLERELSAAEEARASVRERLPSARQQATDARVSAGRTQTKMDSRESRIVELTEKETAARQRFRDALAAEGVWPAAVADPVEAPADPTEAFEILKGQAKDGVSEDVVLGKLQTLQTALAGSHDIVAQRSADILTVTVTGAQGPRPVAVAAREVADRLAAQRGLLSEEYQQIFDAFMLRDLADKLAAQIEVADDLCRRMNETLDVARSSQGVHVQLAWQPAPDLDDEMRHALSLVRTPFAKRGTDQDERLRAALTERITAERDGHTGDYADVLGRALDYRTWYRFTVRVRDAGPDGAPRTRRMRQLSSGETRLISYVTLFAAASAFYDAVSTGAERPPMRLVLLDEAFERLDEPTIARMLGLLVDLDMDWIITWPSGWGLSEKIPRMHIFDVLRPKGGSGIACTHAIWTGSGLTDEDGSPRDR